MGRTLYSRKDLDSLKKLDRSGVIEALGSFEDRGFSDDDFILKAAELVDAGRVPGLEAAVASGKPADVAGAVFKACAKGAKKEPATASPAEVEQAEEVLRNRFQFYDEAYQLPESIDWDSNPGTAHWGHDLNRFSYLGLLSRVYRATRSTGSGQAGDERFGRKAVELILDWIAKCDMGKAFVGTPYVFGSYLNEAIHCSGWARCVRQLLPYRMVTPDELVRILKSLHDQLAYLEIVTNGHAGNWPTIGCQGILGTLAALPVLRDTDRFVDYCIRTMAEQVDEQVLPDGVQDELTPHYHSVVVNNILSAQTSLRELGRSLEPRTLATLRKMVHYTQQTIVPDRSSQVAFNDSDPAAVPHLADRLKGLGLAGCLSKPDKLGPELFPYAGVAFLRQRADRGDLYLAFDAGPYGRGHQHEDKLGFWLFAYGRNLLVDPGRHLYDRSEKSYRAYLCSTRAHSTITVDGAHQHSAGRRDTWIAKAPLPIAWDVKPGEVRASASYDLGYGEANAIAVVHRREIVFAHERFWVVFDRVEGQGEHLLETRFQFAPGDVEVELTRARTCFDDANLLLWALPTRMFEDVHVEKGVDGTPEKPAGETPAVPGRRGGWYSSRYGKIEPAPALSLSVKTTLPFFSATLLFPYRGAADPAVVYSLEGHTAVVRSREVGEVRVESTL